MQSEFSMHLDQGPPPIAVASNLLCLLMLVFGLVKVLRSMFCWVRNITIPIQFGISIFGVVAPFFTGLLSTLIHFQAIASDVQLKGFQATGVTIAIGNCLRQLEVGTTVTLALLLLALVQQRISRLHTALKLLESSSIGNQQA